MRGWGVVGVSIVAPGVSNTWNLVLPDAVLGFYGSCVMVPCRFSVPEQMNQDLLSCSNGGLWRARAIDGPFVIGPNVALPQVAKRRAIARRGHRGHELCCFRAR